MRLFWTQSAVRDLSEARAYISAEDPGAAARVAHRILEVAAMISDTPRIGKPGRALGTREMSVPSTPYVIIYRLKAETLEVLRVMVMHGRRRWP